jgi:cation diffusion facilitator CzcD-associated flavoprotein CzcO
MKTQRLIKIIDKYTEDELRTFREKPDVYLNYRREIEQIMNMKPEILFKDTDAQKAFFRLNDDSMKAKLAKKPEIYASLRPDFSPFCRRLTPGPGYLEALVEDNVDFIGCGIETIVENGIKANDGKVREVDVIICATGYNT